VRIRFARRAPATGGELIRHPTFAQIALVELVDVKDTTNTNPVVGKDAFPRPTWRPAMSEFQRRTLENAEYRHHIPPAQPVVAQHPPENQQPTATQPERASPLFHEEHHCGFQLHWPRLYRAIARVKRVFGG